MTQSVFQTPAVPRFYIDDFQFLLNLGWTANHPDYTVDGDQELDGQFFYSKKQSKGLCSLQPHMSRYTSIPYPGGSDTHDNPFVFDHQLFQNQPLGTARSPIPSTTDLFDNKLFCALLNHTMKGKFVKVKANTCDEYGAPTDEIVELEADTANAFEVNWGVMGEAWTNNGWSLTHLLIDQVPTNIAGIYPCFGIDTAASNIGETLGAWVVGHYFDMDHAMNLEISMGYDYEGYKAKDTVGGSTSININYTKSPAWGGLGQMELDHAGWTSALDHMPHSRSGRRFWDITFSMYDRAKIFPENSAISPDWIRDEDGSDGNGITFENDTGFYARVIHKTLGGALPFIFCPDKENPNADTFAICRFDQNNFEFKQTAPNIWEFNLRIIETW